METSAETTPAAAVQRFSRQRTGGVVNSYLLSEGGEALLFDV